MTIYRLDDVWDESMKLVGTCDVPRMLRWMGDAIQLIVGKCDVENLKGTIDVCTVGCACTGAQPCSRSCGRMCLTMPREVQTVIAVNIGGKPALGFAQLFNHHLNGPGDCCTGCDFSWMDLGAFHSTYKDIITPSKLVAYTQTPADNNKQLVVFGYDSAGNLLRRQVNGVWQNGFLVPLIFGIAVPGDDAPTVARITGIFKEPTVGSVRLSTIDDSGATGITLGVYEPDETVPTFRRIQLNRCTTWARVSYLKTVNSFTSRYDHVPLNSRRAFLLAMQSIKLYSELDFAGAHSCEADAARLEIEQQHKLDAPLYFPIQVVDMNSLRDKTDWAID